MNIVKKINWRVQALSILIVAIGVCLIITIIGHFDSAGQNQISNRTELLPRYGLTMGIGLIDLSDEDLESRLSELDKLGGGWVRLDFEWNRIQPDSAKEYEWEAYDRLVRALLAHRYKIIGILDFTPGWARLPDCKSVKQCAPASSTDYATFAGQVAEHYRADGLHYWEIWNEPNTTNFFKPKPNPTLYTEMLTKAYKSIHDVNSEAIVITGSTAPSASSNGNISQAGFLASIYDNNGGKYFDAVGAHPYTYPVEPSYKSDHAWAALAHSHINLRKIMVAHRDKLKKIWLTEFGAPTNGPGELSTHDQPNLENHPDHVSEELQASMLRDAFALHAESDWAGPLLIYSDLDAGISTETNENFFGLSRADGSRKPAYNVFAGQTATHGP